MALKSIPLLREIVWPQLTAVGATATLPVKRIKNHTFVYTLANKNTNVIVQPEGSLDGTNWFVMATAVTQTANGTYGFTIANTPVLYVRFNMTAENGGTAATVNVSYLGSS